jgi:hypothetical protein
MLLSPATGLMNCDADKKSEKNTNEMDSHI